MITIATIINLFLQEYKPLWDDIKKKGEKGRRADSVICIKPKKSKFITRKDKNIFLYHMKGSNHLNKFMW